MKTKFFRIVFGVVFILSASGAPVTARETPPSQESLAATSSPISLVNQIGGGTYSVAVQGSYAYMGVGPRLVILDITNPTNPSPIGQTEVISNHLTDIEILGNYAYVTESPRSDYSGGGLRIIDISNPAAPHSVSFYDTPGGALSLAVSGTYAYVADEEQGLHIVNIATPAHPVSVVTIKPDTAAGGSTKDVVIVDHYAYVAESYNNGLHILDISDPSNPVTLGRYADRAVHGVAVAGNYAYLACTGTPTGGMSIVNISNPATPQEVGFYGAEVYSSWVQIQGDYAYLATDTTYPAYVKSLHIINVANPTAPTPSGIFSSSYDYDSINEPYQFDFTTNLAYLAAGAGGLQIISLANPAAPTMVGTYNIPTRPGAIAAAGNYLYVADEHWTLYTDTRDIGDLYIMDIANPTKPHTVGIYDTQGVIDSIAISGTYAFAGKHVRYDFNTRTPLEGGLQVLNVSDPAHPAETVFYDSGKRPVTHVALQGNHAYLCLRGNEAGVGGIHFVDISTPANPQSAGQYDYTANDIAISGDYAYLAGQRLNVINIADLSVPNKVGEYGTYSTILSVAVSENYAYIGYYNLETIKITDPANPVLSGSLRMGSNINDIVISGKYAYLAVGGSGLHVVNIADPQNPVEVARYPIPGTLNNVAIAGNIVYVTAETAGIYIFSVTPPSTISGQVTDSKGAPVANVVISANDFYTATTDASGVYTLTDIPAGNYTLTPSKEGILWWEPAQRHVTVPPSPTSQDFVGHHIRKAVAATGEKVVRVGDILTYTITLAYPGSATIALFDPVSQYTDYITGSLQAPPGLSFDMQTHAVTGTVSLLDSDPVEITFAVEVQVSGSIGFAPAITNRACSRLPGQTLASCEWSNTVSNPTYLWFTYLPLVIRN